MQWTMTVPELQFICVAYRLGEPGFRVADRRLPRVALRSQSGQRGGQAATSPVGVGGADQRCGHLDDAALTSVNIDGEVVRPSQVSALQLAPRVVAQPIAVGSGVQGDA